MTLTRAHDRGYYYGIINTREGETDAHLQAKRIQRVSSQVAPAAHASRLTRLFTASQSNKDACLECLCLESELRWIRCLRLACPCCIVHTEHTHTHTQPMQQARHMMKNDSFVPVYHSALMSRRCHIWRQNALQPSGFINMCFCIDQVQLRLSGKGCSCPDTNQYAR